MQIRKDMNRQNTQLPQSLSILLTAILFAGAAGALGCATGRSAASSQAGLAQGDYSRLLETHRRETEIEARETKRLRIPEITAAECEQRGDLYLKQGNMDAAFIQYVKGIRLDPDNMRLRYKQGRLLLQRGMTAEARKEFDSILQAEPNSPLAHEGIGRIHFQEGNLAEAEASFGKALEQNGALWQVHNFLGLICDSKKDHEGAIEHYEQALSLKPGDLLSLNNLGLSFYMSGQHEQAARAFEQAVRNRDANEKIYNNYALVLGAAQRHEQALEVLRKCGDDAKAYNNLGLIFMKHGEHLRAKTAFETAIDLSPAYFVEAHKNLRKVNEVTQPKPVSVVQEMRSLLKARESAASAPADTEKRLEDTGGNKAAVPKAGNPGNHPKTEKAPVQPAPDAEIAAARSGNPEPAFPEPASHRVRIREINVLNENGHVAIRIEADGSIKSDVYPIGDHQIAIDLPGTETDLNVLPQGQSPVANIRMGQLRKRLLVLLDLEKPAPYSVRREEKAVTVVFNDTPPKTGVRYIGASETAPNMSRSSRSERELAVAVPVRIENPLAESGAFTETILIAKPAPATGEEAASELVINASPPEGHGSPTQGF